MRKRAIEGHERGDNQSCAPSTPSLVSTGSPIWMWSQISPSSLLKYSKFYQFFENFEVWKGLNQMICVAQWIRSLTSMWKVECSFLPCTRFFNQDHIHLLLYFLSHMRWSQISPFSSLKDPHKHIVYMKYEKVFSSFSGPLALHRFRPSFLLIGSSDSIQSVSFQQSQ